MATRDGRVVDADPILDIPPDTEDAIVVERKDL